MSFGRKREAGFSLVELLIVVAVVLAVIVAATPAIITMIYNIRLRSSAYALSGLMQSARTQAIRENSYLYICYQAINNSTLAWATTDSACTAPLSGDPQVQMGGNVAIVTSGAPGGIASLLSFAVPSGPLVTAKPAFNARGLPCYVSASRCDSIINVASSSQIVSYILYLSDSRPIGSNGWAAVSVSPAGRTQVWMYSGSGWGK